MFFNNSWDKEYIYNPETSYLAQRSNNIKMLTFSNKCTLNWKYVESCDTFSMCIRVFAVIPCSWMWNLYPTFTQNSGVSPTLSIPQRNNNNFTPITFSWLIYNQAEKLFLPLSAKLTVCISVIVNDSWRACPSQHFWHIRGNVCVIYSELLSTRLYLHQHNAHVITIVLMIHCCEVSHRDGWGDWSVDWLNIKYLQIWEAH